MEAERSRCVDCGHSWSWYSFKWAVTEERQEHNRTNQEDCPRCGGHNVEWWHWDDIWWTRCQKCGRSYETTEEHVCKKEEDNGEEQNTVD